jgi:hypothetical protein
VVVPCMMISTIVVPLKTVSTWAAVIISFSGHHKRREERRRHELVDAPLLLFIVRDLSKTIKCNAEIRF